MADNYLNSTGLAYYHGRISNIFATDADLDALSARVDGIIAEGGEPNVIETVKVNGTALVPDAQKAVNVVVPTAVSALTNDSDFQTGTEVQGAIDAALADITGFDFQIVSELPATGEKGTIYLVPKTGSAPDVYDEYIWVTPSGGTPGFEKIGSTDIDLSGYWSKQELTAITTAQIDTILA